MPHRQRVLVLIRRHGWNATVFQTLETGYSYFFHGNDACVAYLDTGSAWVAAGAPIAAHESVGEAACAFIAEAHAHRKRCCFFASEDRLQVAANGELRSLAIGEQPVWDPALWPTIVARHRSLREQLRRARAKGICVREVSASELHAGPMRAALRGTSQRWLATRGLAPMAFLVRVEPFVFAEDRRCFVAERSGHLVGFAGVIPVPARGGWFLDDLVREPDAPNGTCELLVDSVMGWAQGLGCRWLTLGLTPLAGDVALPLQWARRTASSYYNFGGLRSFKAKFQPATWMPIHLAFPRSQGPTISLVDSLAAFSEGGFLRFAARSVRWRSRNNKALLCRHGL